MCSAAAHAYLSGFGPEPASSEPVQSSVAFEALCLSSDANLALSASGLWPKSEVAACWAPRG